MANQSTTTTSWRTALLAAGALVALVALPWAGGCGSDGGGGATGDGGGCAEDGGCADTTPVGPVCGDNVRDPGEACDGDVAACTAFGRFTAGQAPCLGDCTGYDTAACVGPRCGNGRIEEGEVCDRGSVICSLLGYSSGLATCQPDCLGYDTAGCGAIPGIVCGDGARGEDEVCDGDAAPCGAFGFATGDAPCRDDCTGYDTSGCEGVGDKVCGNGVHDEGEACDGGRVSCAAFGYATGVATCRPDCAGFDVSTCGGPASVCGDGTIDEGESCDGPKPCAELGFVSGTAPCRDDCSGYEVGACEGPVCGDGRVEGGEVCDGGERPCAELGYATGEAPCHADCAGWDASQCDVANQAPRVAIYVRNATIGPGKADGTQWDGFGELPTEAEVALAAALASIEPHAAVLVFLVDPIIAELAKPDPYGWADLAVSGVFPIQNNVVLRSESDNETNTFLPQWRRDAGWVGVRLTPGLRVKVEVWDDDLFFPDAIGVVEIGVRELEAALAAGAVHQVNVADQAQRQLLFVGISVLPMDP